MELLGDTVLTHEELGRFAKRSYFIRSGFHGDFLEEVVADFQPDQLRSFVDTAFAMIKPDAVVSGRLGAACEWLRRNSFVIVDAEAIWAPEEAQFESLYKYNLTLKNEQNQIGSWWINKQVYTLGPSVRLLIKLAPPYAGRCVYEELARRKGPSDPLIGQAGQLRHDLRASNMAMNLFHCADDPFSSARELLIFEEPGSVRAIVDRLGTWSDAKLTLTANEQLARIEAALAAPQSVDASQVAASLVVRAALKLNHPKLVSKDLLLSASAVQGSTKSALQALRIALDDLQSAIASQRADEDLSLLACFARYPVLADREVSDVLARLAARGVPISAWERLTLTTTTHYRAAFLKMVAGPSADASTLAMAG